MFVSMWVHVHVQLYLAVLSTFCNTKSMGACAKVMQKLSNMNYDIPAFSSSRFLAASALCCRIRAKRSVT